MIRLIDKTKDLPIVHSWWKERGWGKLPAEMLPETGVMVELDGRPVAAGWLYKTDSSIAWLEYIISDPASRRDERKSAVHQIVGELIRQAKSAGFKIIFTTTPNPSLKGRLLDLGFVEGDKNMSSLIRRIA